MSTSAPIERPAIPAKTKEATKTVFVVDDYGILCNLISCQLTALGYHVLTAFDGKEAKEKLAAFGARNIDLLITDLHMPRMSGDELAEWFQHENHKAKVLLMSTEANGTEVDDTFHYLHKPFVMTTLASHVRELLEGYSDFDYCL